ncbi:hypothetical protein ANN_19319 [Periplaneta americana]|uniref:DDE-1 domain-containing protein n=1 Tax=Periplaneta americana TaxID=6978 RepID=A0ABQ8S9T2_PERAM|nr:hypothetical protein ANN_19319 [Periplaneta americana]
MNNQSKKKRYFEKLKADPIRLEAYREKEKRRLKNIRSKEKEELTGRLDLQEEKRKQETLRKREYRKKKKLMASKATNSLNATPELGTYRRPQSLGKAKHLKQVVCSGPVSEVITEIKKQLPKFMFHCYVKNTQSEEFELQKERTPESGVLQIDFAENYSIVYQDEIQSAHWSHAQVTLFTACAWIGGNKISYTIVSDDLLHGKLSVRVFLYRPITDLLKKFPGLKKLSIFSDGTASQFKNKFSLSLLCSMKTDFEIDVEWLFFATSHGKGAVDVIGGALKRRVWNAVKSRKRQVSNACEFHQCAKDEIKGTILFYIPKEEVLAYEELMNKQWEKVAAIPKIQRRNDSESDARETDKSSDECENMSSLEQSQHNIKHPVNLEGLNPGKFIEVELTSDMGLKHKYHAICNGKVQNEDIKVGGSFREIRGRMPKKPAAKKYNIPRSTLQFRLSAKFSKSSMGPASVLSEDEERLLVKWIVTCARKGFPQRKLDVQLSVKEFLTMNQRKTPFKDNMPGDGGSIISSSPSRGFHLNKFKQVEDILEEGNSLDILEDSIRIFNGDESGFQLCPETGKVLAFKGDRNVYEVDRGPAKLSITTMFAISASGQMCPPMIICPYQRIPNEITKRIPDDWEVEHSIILIALYPNATRRLQDKDFVLVDCFHGIRTILITQNALGKTEPQTESRNHGSNILTYGMFEEIVVSKLIAEIKTKEGVNEAELALKRLTDSFLGTAPQDPTEEINEERTDTPVTPPRVTVEAVPSTCEAIDVDCVNNSFLELASQHPADKITEERTEGVAVPPKVAVEEVPSTSVAINLECAPETVKKMSPLGKVLQWSNTPRRKFKRNTERMPFVITCKTWKVLFEEKESKKKEEALAKEERKKKREDKRRKGMCFKCTKTVRLTDLECSLCKKLFIENVYQMITKYTCHYQKTMIPMFATSVSSMLIVLLIGWMRALKTQNEKLNEIS